MPTDEQKQKIAEVMKARQIAIAGFLIESATGMSVIAAQEELAILARNKYTIAVADGITDRIIAEYAEDLLAGGTKCIERVLEETPSGMFRATTRRKFVPWLDDMTEKETTDIVRLIGDAEQAGMHPRNIAERLGGYFEGTAHNAMTAARTEAAKIRNDARAETMVKNGVQYVQYQTANDELVRPEHAMRDGKIYRHEDAPWMGEYNCRCVLSPADYMVEEKGARVEESQAEYLTPDQAGEKS